MAEERSELTKAIRWLNETAMRDDEVKPLLLGSLQRTDTRNVTELARLYPDQFWIIHDTVQSMLEQLPQQDLT